jgi:hypothetical protein
MDLREIGLGSVCEWLRLAQDRGGGGLLWIRWWTCWFWRYGVMTSTLRQVPCLSDHLCCSVCKGFKRWCVTFSILFFWTWSVVRHSRTKTFRELVLLPSSGANTVSLDRTQQAFLSEDSSGASSRYLMLTF